MPGLPINVPAELQRRALAEARAKSALQDSARDVLVELAAPESLARQRQLFLEGYLDLEEFEYRVEVVLREGARWWWEECYLGGFNPP